MNQVCHEGDFGNDAPSRPGEEVVDNASQSSTTGKDKPRQAKAPHQVAACVPKPCCRLARAGVFKVCVIGCIDQSKEEEKYRLPDEKINSRRNVDLLSFCYVKEMAQEKTHYVALVSSPIDGKILGLHNIHPTGYFSRYPVSDFKRTTNTPSN